MKNYLLSKDKSKATIEIIQRSVYQFSNWCEDERIDPEQATYSEILSYMKHMQSRGVKQRTIQMHISHLGHYFKWLISREIRTTHPTDGIDVKGVQRKFLYHIIPMKELEAVYEKIQGNEAYLSGTYRVWDKQQHYSQKCNKVVFGLMIWQGLGTSEINNLRLDDVKLREGRIYIAGDRRSNERTLKLESAQLFDLMEYLQTVRPYYQRSNKEENGLLFITQTQGARPTNRMSSVVKLVNKINPQLTSGKQIRASVITYWLKNYNLRESQYRAGHRYVSSTEAYLVNDLEDLQEDITKFHPLG